MEGLALRPRKIYCLFPVHNSLKKNRVGRSAKFFFLLYFFGQKCVFYACFGVGMNGVSE